MADALVRLRDAVARLSTILRERKDVGELAAVVARDACALVGAESCSVMLLDTDRKQLSCFAAHGLSPEEVREIRFRVGEGAAGTAVAERKTVSIPDVTEDARFSARAQALTIRSLLVVPVVVRGDAIGALSVTHSRPGAFDETEAVVLDLWAQAVGLDLESALLYRLSLTDALTRVYNRRYLEEVVPKQLEGAVRAEQPVAALFIDLDDFKQVNDRYGHDAGDAVLVETGARVRSCVRETDVVLRYGGDEFLALLIGPSALQADAVATRISDRLESTPVEVGGLMLAIRASVGVAASGTADEAFRDLDELLRQVDQALYQAKAARKS
jgi:diguanylate cyclase (GGDEF)-like protein